MKRFQNVKAVPEFSKFFTDNAKVLLHWNKPEPFREKRRKNAFR
jgi:hypothetical protein